MAEAYNKFENFLSAVRTQFLPRSERFEVAFFGPAGVDKVFEKSLSLYCEEAQIPGLAATNVPIKIGPWTEHRTQNVEFITTDMTFSFIVDGGWEGRKYFDTWIGLTADFTSKEVGFYDLTKGKIEIKSLDLNDVVLAEWTLHDVLPKVINLVPISWGNIGVMRMNVTVSARYWEKTK